MDIIVELVGIEGDMKTILGFIAWIIGACVGHKMNLHWKIALTSTVGSILASTGICICFRIWPEYFNKDDNKTTYMYYIISIVVVALIGGCI